MGPEILPALSPFRFDARGELHGDQDAESRRIFVADIDRAHCCDIRRGNEGQKRMTMDLRNYLGRHIDELLNAEPFSRWQVVRSIENDPAPEFWYEFEGHGVEVICDGLDRIRTVFLHRGDGESLIDIPFAMSRNAVLERLGPSASSGGGTWLPGTGNRGPWDRFVIPQGNIHIQYTVGRDEIDMVTLTLKPPMS